MEYDENKAIAAIADALKPDKLNEDTLFEILDLIFDYYEQNGDLDIDFDDDSDDDDDIDAIAAFVARFMNKNGNEVITLEQIKKAVKAELEYEESLL